MARQDALLRLHQTLLGRRADLRKLLADELANLRDFRAADSTTDSIDVAFETSSDEIAALLAELDARDLSQIERALARVRRGTYGVCEGGGENCQQRIPVARLTALPYTTFCINCEREMEKHPERRAQRDAGNWMQIRDSEAPVEDQSILHTIER
jgi:DnaK suppressor protein